MGFRTPLTSLELLDTGPVQSGPGVRVFQDNSGSWPAGVVQWRSGVADDQPGEMRLTPQVIDLGGGDLVSGGNDFTFTPPASNGEQPPGWRTVVTPRAFGGYRGLLELGSGPDLAAGAPPREVQLSAGAYLRGGYGRRFIQGGLNAGYGSTAFVWVPGLGPKQTIPADDVARAWEVSAAVSVTGEGFWRFRLDLAANPDYGYPATSSYWPNATGFRAAAGAGEISSTIQAAGTLTGAQAATWYLEARAAVVGGAGFFLPTQIYRFT